MQGSDEALAGWSFYEAESDLALANSRVPYEVPIPFGLDTLEEIQHLPSKLWIDAEGLIRRVNVRTGLVTELTLEFDQFGTALPDTYWERLATPTTPT